VESAAQVSRTFYARDQTGQQLLLGAYSALMRQVHAGTVRLLTRREGICGCCGTMVDGRHLRAGECVAEDVSHEANPLATVADGSIAACTDSHEDSTVSRRGIMRKGPSGG